MGRRSLGEREGSNLTAVLIRTSCGQPQWCILETRKFTHTQAEKHFRPQENEVGMTEYWEM